MNSILINCEKKMPIVKNPIKINTENIIIPTIKNYNDISNYNYNLSQLKIITKFYKLKIGGNKTEIISRIFSFLYLSSYIIKIQKIFRGFLAKKYKTLHGPASMNRKLCTNNSDFVTMEPIEEINFHQFISYKDLDGFIYGFDITSLFTSMKNSGNELKNPYNRTLLPLIILHNVKTLIRLGKILKIPINLTIEDDTLTISNEKVIELRILSLFQNINALGNYSNSEWFLSLNRNNLIKMVRELADTWNYRAQLLPNIKRNICPPYGDPFRNLSMSYIHNEPNINNVRKVIIEVFEKLVNIGLDNDSKALGAYYVLGALTLVNTDAAIALPWLYQSFI
jgi:hypothetical protein